MVLAKLKMALAFVLVSGGLIALVGPAAIAQNDAKKEEPKKVEPKAADPKVDKKPAKDEPDNVVPLNERLKKHEQEIARIRELMLKEINAEIDKLEAAIKKAQDEFMKGDRTALRNSGRLMGEKARLQAMRVQVDRGMIGRGGAFPAAASMSSSACTSTFLPVPCGSNSAWPRIRALSSTRSATVRRPARRG
jgi:hypothetical protein